MAIRERTDEGLTATHIVGKGFLSHDDAVFLDEVAAEFHVIHRRLDLLFAGHRFVPGSRDHGHVGLTGDFCDLDASLEFFFHSLFLLVGWLVKHGSGSPGDHAHTKVHFLVLHELGDLFNRFVLLPLEPVVLPCPEAEIVSQLELVQIAELLALASKEESGVRSEFRFEGSPFFDFLSEE